MAGGVRRNLGQREEQVHQRGAEGVLNQISSAYTFWSDGLTGRPSMTPRW
ncbi:hypothetical protein FRUB_06115 [Fimbriiglobus ruber]|uniref:Uncharacterized protein n=1 Tax=Fimbriiglobus ruber TaxID=1908690 RepID=A0A225DDK5_9BACT|nr:hypothetical protein FRUB_06115 [Fimbriiglobus ruber]